MRTILLFPGQGTQAIGMGKSWYDSSEIVRNYFERANKILPFNITELCFNGPTEVLQETRVCQPALFVVGYTMFAHLKEIGWFEKNPLLGATGLSLGELTALATAGVFDFETALQIVAERGRLMQEACELEPTGMLALIAGSTEAIQQLCSDFDLDISNLNCPGQTVVSGTLANLEKAQFVAKERGFKIAVPLKVAGAYHSRWMMPAREKFEKFIQKIPFNKPNIVVLTNTTGKPINDPDEIRKALGVQLTSTVLFEACLRYCNQMKSDICLECGPGNVIAGLAKRTEASLNIKSISEINSIQNL